MEPRELRDSEGSPVEHEQARSEGRRRESDGDHMARKQVGVRHRRRSGAAETQPSKEGLRDIRMDAKLTRMQGSHPE